MQHFNPVEGLSTALKPIYLYFVLRESSGPMRFYRGSHRPRTQPLSWKSARPHPLCRSVSGASRRARNWRDYVSRRARIYIERWKRDKKRFISALHIPHVLIGSLWNGRRRPNHRDRFSWLNSRQTALFSRRQKREKTLFIGFAKSKNEKMYHLTINRVKKTTAGAGGSARRRAVNQSTNSQHQIFSGNRTFYYVIFYFRRWFEL